MGLKTLEPPDNIVISRLPAYVPTDTMQLKAPNNVHVRSIVVYGIQLEFTQECKFNYHLQEM